MCDPGFLAHHHPTKEEEILTDILTTVQRLANDVKTNTDAVASILQFNRGLAQELDLNRGNPDAIAKLADDLEANNKTVADYILANTQPPAPPVVPSAPQPVQDPPPAPQPVDPAPAPAPAPAPQPAPAPVA